MCFIKHLFNRHFSLKVLKESDPLKQINISTYTIYLVHDRKDNYIYSLSNILALWRTSACANLRTVDGISVFHQTSSSLVAWKQIQRNCGSTSNGCCIMKCARDSHWFYCISSSNIELCVCVCFAVILKVKWPLFLNTVAPHNRSDKNKIVWFHPGFCTYDIQPCEKISTVHCTMFLSIYCFENQSKSCLEYL